MNKNAANPPRVPSAANTAAPAYDVNGPRKAIDSDGSGGDDAAFADDTMGADDTFVEDTAMGVSDDEEMMGYANGGAVMRYDDGGAVEDDEDFADDTAPEDDGDDEEIGAIPSSPTAQAPAPAPAGKGPGFSYDAAHDAAREGVLGAMSATGADQDDEPAGAIPTDVSAQRRPRGSQSAYLARAGAAQQAEMDEVRKAIDPEGRMTESQRNMAALAHVYEYNLKQNNPEGAQRAAASMMQYFGQMSGRYQSLAKVAAESGDVDGAVKNMLKAHANIPDGIDLRVVKTPKGISYTYMDEKTGKTYEQGVASPEEILSFATKGAQTSMEGFLAQASGRRAGTSGTGKAAAAPKAPREPSPDKLGDVEKGQELMNTAWTELVGGMTTKDGKPAEIDPKIAASVKDDAYRIFMHAENRKRGVNPRIAAMVAGNLAIPDPDNPQARGFKLDTVEGGRVVQLGDGRTAFVPENEFNRLITQRGKAQQKLSKAGPTGDNPADETGGMGTEKPGFVRGAVDAYNSAPRAAQAPAKYGNPLAELHQSGRVSGRALEITPTGPSTEIDKINAARRAVGQPPITEDQLSQAR
jgi:hypothetical protein